jgi:PTH1 family peptidyl-tRNA hydrolase
MTYMNLSGRSVKKVAGYYNVVPADTLVVLDDVALNFARILLKATGSAGGHRGLASVQESLGTTCIPRLRVGIGDRVHGLLEDYVLGKFSAGEAAKLDALCEKSVEAMNLWLKERIDIAMNLANAAEKPKGQHKHLPLKGEEKVDE